MELEKEKFYCPKCHAEISSNEKGICSECNETYFPDWALTNNDRIFVKDKQLLPDICYICGEPSDKYIMVKEAKKIKDKKYSLIWAIINELNNWNVFRSFIFKAPIDNTINLKIEARLPICKRCKKTTKKQIPESVDFRNNQMEFKVHQTLREEFKRTCFIYTSYINYD